MFVGREAELGALQERLRHARLVTLLGIGGIGKSRLAQEAARRSAQRFVFCDLSAARTEEDVCSTVAAALEVGLAVAGTLRMRIEAVGRAIAASAGPSADASAGAVLVLDAAEAVAEVLARLVEEWLALAPAARVLVTSRVRLGAPSEHVVALEPLPVEAPSGLSDAERLYLERARAAGATVTDADIPSVRALVQALDGIPLAIELVAARARLFPVEALRARIEGGAEPAFAGERAQRRHATMRGVVAGSWELLDAPAQEALLACACFRGGLSAESAEAMLAPPALEVLARLADASLVRSTPTREGAARFDLFHSVRAFAQERMDERPELRRALFRRHAEHMAEAARGFRLAAPASGGAVYLSRLALEHDNLAIALMRLLDEAPLESLEPLDEDGARIALTLATELEPLRMVRGHAATYVEWVGRALAAAGGEALPSGLRALGLHARLSEARALSELGVAEESRAAFRQALAVAVEAQDSSGEGYARCGLARLDAYAGKWREALEGFGQAKVCAVRARDEALLHLSLASESFHGSELHDAEEHLIPLERAAAYFGGLGDERESLFWAVQLGRAYTDFDRPERAYARLSDALSRARAIGDRRSEGFASFGLGGVFLSRGELEQAATSYRAAIAILGEVGKERDRGYALGYLGVVEHARGRFDEADAAYTEACAALSAVGDEPNVVLFSLFAAGLLADRDRTNDAAGVFSRVKARAEGWTGTGMRPVVAEVIEALVDASRARAAFRQSDFGGFAQHRRAAASRLRAAEKHPELIESAREVYDWRDVSLDVRVACRLAKRAVDAVAALRLPELFLVVARESARIRPRPDGDWVDLRSRRVLQRILERLVAERLAAVGAVVSAESLVEAGWPGQALSTPAARNRLHVALGSLRQLGLEEILETVPGGWRIRADVPVLRAEDAEEPG
jgi:predicted ATPase